jgi:hypothetical protein
MRGKRNWRLVRRLTLLAALAVFAAALTLPSQVAAVAELCVQCDENFYVCHVVNGGNYTTCRQQYDECLVFCEFRGPSGGGGGGTPDCGRGRTACEQSCYSQKQDCMESESETCGEEYQACMEGCCPS